MLVALDDKSIDAIYKIWRIWEQDTLPDDWTKAIFVIIHKKGPRDICGNYWTVAPISHATKMTLWIITERIKPYILSQLPPEQTGFVPERDIREQILNLNQIIVKVREFNVPTYLWFFFYYTKAFDFVHWQNLWRILNEMGTPYHATSIIKNLYEHNEAYVRLESELSDSFYVRQGCVLTFYCIICTWRMDHNESLRRLE